MREKHRNRSPVEADDEVNVAVDGHIPKSIDERM